MARRKKKESLLAILIVGIFTLIIGIITIIFKILFFFFEWIIFHTSKYSKKTNNGFLKTYFDKGNYGEFRFYRKLIRIIPSDQILANVYLEKKTDETTEIDLIAVTRKGIYVIEYKNYSGWIFGNQNNRMWTQTFHKNSKHQFFNPIWQNKLHTSAVINNLKVEEKVIIPLVVFSNKSKLQKLEIGTNMVLLDNKAFDLIKRNEKQGVDILSPQQVYDYHKQLSLGSLQSEEVKREHIENIQIKQELIAENICPNCNIELVKKEGKYGEYLGCINNNKGCNFTKSI